MSLINSWQLPLVASGVGFHLAVSWSLLWRYFQAWERSLLYGGLSWLVLTLHAASLFYTYAGGSAAAGLLADLTLAAASLAFLARQLELDGKMDSLRPFLRLAGVLLLAVGIGAGDLVGFAVKAFTLLGLGGAAALAYPTIRQGGADLSHRLFFTGYAAGAVYGLLRIPANHPSVLLLAGYAAFSLLLSAATTWQSWEHTRAVRLFSRALERLNRPLTTREALDEALALAAETLRVRAGWILLRTEGRGDASGEWTIGAIRGFPGFAERGIQAQRFPIEHCLCLGPITGELLVTEVRDLACVRASQEAGHSTGRHLTIPLGHDGKVAGIMSLQVPKDRFFPSAEKETLTALGEQIGLAIDRARLYDQLKEKEAARGRLLARLITAQEDERRRIARELHDETGQSLTALVVNLDFLTRHPMDEQLLRQRLAEVREMANLTLTEVRRVIHEMRPAVLDDLGLEAAIRWLCRRYEPSGLEIALTTAGLNGNLPDYVAITVFRLIQEACTNAVKHAAASSLRITVVGQEDWLTVEVLDDGRGIDPLRLDSGMGLAGLRERVTLAGGALSIESAPGAGTRLFAELPMGGAEEDDDPRAYLRRPRDGAPGRSYGAAIGAGH